jgi:hypothetical protein
MRFFPARLLTLAAFVPALFLLVAVPGCGKQGEGERCGDEYSNLNNDDCGDGLVCTSVNTNDVYRCCYPDRTTDSRCEKASSSPTSQSAGGASSNAAAGGAAGDSTAQAGAAAEGS